MRKSHSKRTDHDQAAAFARAVLRPTVQAAFTLKECSRLYGLVELSGLVDALTEQASATIKNNLDRAEAMLTAQAHTLDAIFNSLARHAFNAAQVDNLERYLRLALRTQSQCRMTWETLATMKNPPIVGYVRQANIAHGPQQVNNACGTDKISRERESANMESKLMEKDDGERLDPGAACPSGRADSAMAAVAKVNRTEIG